MGRARAVVVALAAVASVSGMFAGLLPFGPAALAGNEPAVRESGFLPFGFKETTPHRMAVDAVLHRGYYVTRVPRSTLWIYDLERLTPVTSIVSDLPAGPIAVDEVHHRLYFAPSQPPINCPGTQMLVFDELTRAFTHIQIPCESNTGTGFFTRGLAYSAAHDRLYAIGASSAASTVTLAAGLSTQREQIVLRQMTLNRDRLDLDWEVDATGLCDSITNDPVAPEPVIGRAANGVLSYCYQNGQGRAIWIPMVAGKPARDANGRPVVNVSPTIGRLTVPVVDQASGRLLIMEDEQPFGPAVYVYDPEHERFLGVIPSGVPPQQNGTFYDYWRGLDATTGKAYILNQAGLVVADIRATPLPPGTAYPILTGGANQIFSGPVSIDGGLHRLFFAYPKRGGFVVVDDHEPRVTTAAADPDAGTADIAEQAGLTDRTFAADATAFGMHVVNTGGIPRVLDNFDVLCTATTNVNDRDQFGRCPADQVVTAGNRELLLASSSLQSGNGTGTVASAYLAVNPPADEATDRDLRNAGAGDGTAGADGKGYPVPGAVCEDFDGRAVSDDAGSVPAGHARAQCDTTHNTSSANAAMAALNADGLPFAVTVAHTSSSVTAKVTGAGEETVSTATARAVDLGGVVSIGAITSTARTVAHGRTGTATTTFTVSFHDVHAPGLDCASCDPSTVVATINRVLGASVRARAIGPHRQATPRGYRAVVEKDPALTASDRAVNDDDSVAATALDLIFYNDSAPTNRDGSAGRSRIVISLAGVQAESRYGVFRLPTADVAAAGVPGGDIIGGAPDVLGALTGSVPPSERPAIDIGGAVTRPGIRLIPRRRITHTVGVGVEGPRELGLLAVTWAVLLSPIYFAGRRRARRRILAS
jgi:hypothetical protein